MASEDERLSLIVYAVPTGVLGAELDRYWRCAAPIRPNAALDYPPHCTVTGFFSRRPADVPATVAALGRAVAEAGPGAATPAVERVVLDGLWFGLVLDAPGLVTVAHRFARSAPTSAGDDPVRPKDEPHLSLAYEFAASSMHTLRTLARGVRHEAPAGWELRLYEGRRAGTWRTIASWSLGSSR